MKAHNALLLGFIIILGNKINAEAQISTFQKTFGSGTSIEYGAKIISKNDSEYIMLSKASDDGAGEIFLSDITNNGNVNWTKKYSGGNGEVGLSVVRSNDGFAITGFTRSFGAGAADVLLIRTNAAGDILWAKTFGGVQYEAGNDIILCSDGGYFIAGRTYSYGNYSESIYLIKTDSMGNVEWTKVISNSGGKEAYAVIQTSDGGYMICGEGNEVYKLGPTGNIIWSKVFNIGGYSQAYSVLETFDRHYVIVGSVGEMYMYCMKIDSLADVIWCKGYGEGSIASVSGTSDNNYILGATVGKSMPQAEYDGGLLKIDNDGNILWAMKYGQAPPSNEMIFCSIQAPDGGFISTGKKGKGYLIKTDSAGISGCYDSLKIIAANDIIPAVNNVSYQLDSGVTAGTANFAGSSGINFSVLCQSLVSQNLNFHNFHSVSPNPFTVSFTLQLNSDRGNFDFYLSDILGREVKFFSGNYSENIVIQRDNLPGGIYFYKLVSGGEIIGSGKIIAE